MAKTPAKSPAELLVPGRALTLCGRRGRRRGLDRRRSRARHCGTAECARDQRAGDLPRRAAHGAACARARVLRARDRDQRVSRLGLPALRPRVAACRHRGAAHDHAVAARAPEGPRAARRGADHRQRCAAARAAARPDRDAIALGRARQHAGDGRRHQVARAQRLQPHRDGARAGRLCGARRHHRSLSARHRRSGAARLLRRHAGVDPHLRCRDAALDGHACARSIWCRSPNSSSPARPSAASAPAMWRRSAPPPTIRSTRRSAKAAAIPAWSTGCRCSTASSTRCSTICPAAPVVDGAARRGCGA